MKSFWKSLETPLLVGLMWAFVCFTVLLADRWVKYDRALRAESHRQELELRRAAYEHELTLLALQEDARTVRSINTLNLIWGCVNRVCDAVSEWDSGLQRLNRERR